MILRFLSYHTTLRICNIFNLKLDPSDPSPSSFIQAGSAPPSGSASALWPRLRRIQSEIISRIHSSHSKSLAGAPNSKGHATADRAHGNLEGRAPRAAGAHAVGTGKPYFYGAGRILGRVSRLYGYSMLLSGISSLFVTGISSLPLTKWDDKDNGGVPRAHNELVNVLLMLWFSAGVSCL